MIRYLLTHPQYGVFLGVMLGFGFWSGEDPCGQDHAVTFESEVEAQEMAESHPPDFRGKCSIVPVELEDGKFYATMDQCISVGIPAWDPWQK